MITKFLNWLTTPETKIIKTTYGNGIVSYEGFYRVGKFSSWIIARDYSNYSKKKFGTKEEVQNLLDEKVKLLTKNPIVKREKI